MRIYWYGGIFITTYSGLKIQLSFVQGSIDDEDLVLLTPAVVTDEPEWSAAGEGVFTRSHDTSEPIINKLDHTTIVQILAQE